MAKLILRVQSKTGTTTVTDLTEEDSIATLKARINGITGIANHQMTVLTGYPPQAIDLSSTDAHIKSAGITTRSTLIVREKESCHVKGTSQSFRTDQKDGVFKLTRREVPSDNSCLFTSIQFLVTSSGGVRDDPSAMRKIVATTILSNPDKYNPVFLCNTPDQYAEWIQRKDTWGGEVELVALANHYGIQLYVVDVQFNSVKCFNEDPSTGMIGFVLYNGIHYDPLFCQQENREIATLFPVSDYGIVVTAARELANEARKNNEYTDLNNFTLQCAECGQILKGDKDASQHFLKTKHTTFKEIKPKGSTN